MQNAIQLDNKHLIVKINFHGAELSRMYSKTFDREILWNGNPQYWNRHAPVLFPFVGKLKHGQYLHKGKAYQLGQHGFARDQKFKLIEHSEKHCVLELESSEASHELYPFDFILRTSFTLTEDTLTTEYTVENKNNGAMYFSIGAHPAFNCPMEENQLEDYQLTFENEESSATLLLDSSGLLSEHKKDFLTNEDTIPLNDSIFRDDALMFTDLKSKSLSINSQKENFAIKVSWNNFPYLGIWKPIGAPFLCIEPWQGIADFSNSTGVLSEKFGIVTLDEKQKFQASYDIQVTK